MPRGHRSKKRRQARSVPQSCGNVQATEAAEEESAPFSSHQFESPSQGLPAAGSCSISQEPQSTPTTTNVSVGDSYPGSDEASNGQDEDEAGPFEAPLFPEFSEVDDFTDRTVCLQLFLLSKYKLKQRVLKEDMLRVVGEDQFAEVLKRTCENIETFFALELIEVDSTSHSYSFVSKLKLPNNGRVRAGRGLPKTGLLMHILGLILMNGNSVSEEEIWRDLRPMKVFPGRKHFFFGEPRKLITKDFVRLKYLDCHQVPESDPPRYQFSWGPKAHLETSKMKVLEFWAKINETQPNAFPSLYDEALRDEELRAQARDAARATTIAQVMGTFQRRGQQNLSTVYEV